MAYPGQDQEAGVVDHEGQVALPRFGGPADEAVAGRGLPGGGAEAEQGEGLAVGGAGEVAQLGAGQGRVAEVVVALDEGVPAAALDGVGDGFDAHRADLAEVRRRREQRRLGGGRRRDRPHRARAVARRRQCDQAAAVHAQHGDAGRSCPSGRRRACAQPRCSHRARDRAARRSAGRCVISARTQSISAAEKSRPQ